MEIKELHETKFEDYYVTVDGEVYSWYGKKPVICMKYLDNGSGYKYVRIGRKNVYVHRLIAETFIPNPENKPQVNHKDGNRANNSVDNLEWVTAKENAEHREKMKVCE